MGGSKQAFKRGTPVAATGLRLASAKRPWPAKRDRPGSTQSKNPDGARPEVRKDRTGFGNIGPSNILISIYFTPRDNLLRFFVHNTGRSINSEARYEKRLSPAATSLWIYAERKSRQAATECPEAPPGSTMRPVTLGNLTPPRMAPMWLQGDKIRHQSHLKATNTRHLMQNGYLLRNTRK